MTAWPVDAHVSRGIPDDEPGSRRYDWWSRRPRLYDAWVRMGASIREDVFDALDATAGEAILDLGCGPGTNFERLRDDGGEDGLVIGLDYSGGMVERATTLVAERGWSNVHVVLGDATETCGSPSSFDAAVATWSLHTMANADAVVENVHRALVPGGRFVVMDARPITEGPARYLNAAYERVIAWAVDHRPGLDTLELLESTFESVDLVDTYDGGAGYVAVARKTAPEPETPDSNAARAVEE